MSRQVREMAFCAPDARIAFGRVWHVWRPDKIDTVLVCTSAIPCGWDAFRGKLGAAPRQN